MFENDALAAEELRTRTSKILGGCVSERLFLDEFVIPSNLPYSKGWWISLREDSEEVLFFVVKNEMTDLDLELFRLLTNRGFAVFQIVCLEDHYEISYGDRFVTVEEFLRLHEIEPKEMQPRQRHTGETLDRCIQYYRNIGMLTEEARSIRIEDTFLNKYFYTSNIDLFVKNPATNQVVCVEIKFKDEFINNGLYVFGEDRLQYETLFPYMRDCGIDVYNCVLYNHLKANRNTTTTDIFNYLDACNGRHYWKKKQFISGENHSTYTFSAGHTAWRGEGGRTVYCIPLSEYSPVSGDLFSVARNNYWGDCPRNGCEGKLVLRSKNDNSGQFFGCTNFRNHS